jgi:Mg-chelatase subunit ChlD
VTVRIGKDPCPVIQMGDNAVVFMVPPVDPATSTVTLTAPGLEVSRKIGVQPILQFDGTPGDVTRRFLDEVEALLAQTRQHLEHPAMGAVTGGVVQPIVFLIDVSESMTGTDLGRPRLDLAKATITHLLRQTVPAVG